MAKLWTIGVSVIGIAMTGSALAADLPLYKAPVAVPIVAAYSWTGLYIGGSLGWEEKRISGSDLFRGLPDRQTARGWLGGAQIGYNHQFGNIVVGTELSGDWDRVHNTSDCFAFSRTAPFIFTPGTTVTTTDSCGAREDWTVRWLNKLGATFGPEQRLLAYLTGGIAVTNLKIDRANGATTVVPSGVVPGSTTSFTSNSTGSSPAVGAVLGVGMQYALTNQLSLGAEFLHGEYATADIPIATSSTTCVTITTLPLCTSSRGFSNAFDQFRTNSVRLVLNYKFGWDTPIVARY